MERADHHQKPVIGAMEDAMDGLAGLEGRSGRLLETG